MNRQLISSTVTLSVVAALLVSMPHVAAATPNVSATATNIGGGLIAYDLFFNANSAVPQVAGFDLVVTSLGLGPPLNQVLAAGFPVSDDNHPLFGAFTPTQAQLDSHFTPALANMPTLLQSGFSGVFGATELDPFTMTGAFGTNPASPVSGSLQIGHFVAPGPINVQGIIQFGVQVNPGINFTVPEPSTAGLLASGAALLLVALQTRRRRRM